MDYTHKVFERLDTVKYYAQHTSLTLAETEIFEKYRSAYAGKRVLDLGVGAGRTTNSLAPHASFYIGVDYSRAMVDICQERFPHYQFEHGDARDLSRFPAKGFDFVLFSFNGIDFSDHAGRLQVLKEVARVLVSGGVFVFSSHNLELAQKYSLWQRIRRFRSSPGRLSVLKRWRRIGLRIRNYTIYRHRQTITEDYAILLDPGNDFTLPIYYVNAVEQETQLRVSGFNVDPHMILEASSEDPTEDQRPYSTYYVARKN